ncbi:MAG: hypothetical protein HN402_06685 [Candidatus Scalindua sp.]|nr:hypothetical protein [Candidatus Scalindua sp.]
MKSKVNTNSNLVKRIYGTDIGKLVFEGIMTIFIVLIFMFIAQNWVLTNVDDDILFTPTCRLTGERAGVSMPVSYETNKIMDSYKITFDNM